MGNRRASASGCGLHAKSPATGEQVQTARPLHHRLQPIEKGLPDAVTGGAQTRQLGKRELSPPMLTTDDAHHRLAVLIIQPPTSRSLCASRYGAPEGRIIKSLPRSILIIHDLHEGLVNLTHLHRHQALRIDTAPEGTGY